MRSRKHLLRADQAAGERVAPRVRVEHGDDRKNGVALVHAQEKRRGERVDCDRPMRVQDSLREPCGPAREAHRGRGALVEVAVRERALVRRRDQLLVVDRAVGRVAGTDRDHVLEAHAVDELRRERPQHLVDHEHAVARVRGDVRVVVGVQAQVERVGHEPAGGRADVRLEVLVVVPHERPDPVAVGEPQPAERHGQALRARHELGVRVPVPALVREARDDLALAVELVRATQDRGDVELVVHHQALHRDLLPRSENPQKRILAA